MEQTLFNWMLGIATTALGWFGHILWTADQELRADLAKLREELPKEYVRQDAVERRFDKIDAALERIWEELREKADK